MGPDSSIKVALLTDKNYHSWSNDMKVLLRGQDLWCVVEQPVGPAPDPLADGATAEERDVHDRLTSEWLAKVKKNDQAYSMIHFSVEQDYKSHIVDCNNSAFDAWNALKLAHGKETRVTLAIIHRRLWHMNISKT